MAAPTGTARKPAARKPTDHKPPAKQPQISRPVVPGLTFDHTDTDLIVTEPDGTKVEVPLRVTVKQYRQILDTLSGIDDNIGLEIFELFDDAFPQAVAEAFEDLDLSAWTPTILAWLEAVSERMGEFRAS